MTDPERLDLSSLSPTADPARFDRAIARLMAASAGEMARRRAPATVLGQLGWWERPMLLAAALLGVVALSTLAMVERSSAKTSAESLWATSVGVPAQLAGWVERGETPTLETALGIAAEDR